MKEQVYLWYMSILGFLFLAFIIYLGYRFVFNFLIPIIRTTRKMRRGFREMQERMNQHAQQFQQKPQAHQNENNNKGKAGEYIDFEEIKD